jgi:hypothetical protein
VVEVIAGLEDTAGIAVDFVDDAGAVFFLRQHRAAGGFGVFDPVGSLLDFGVLVGGVVGEGDGRAATCNLGNGTVVVVGGGTDLSVGGAG